jgi:hypothetical protein
MKEFIINRNQPPAAKKVVFFGMNDKMRQVYIRIEDILEDAKVITAQPDCEREFPGSKWQSRDFDPDFTRIIWVHWTIVDNFFKTCHNLAASS